MRLSSLGDLGLAFVSREKTLQSLLKEFRRTRDCKQTSGDKVLYCFARFFAGVGDENRVSVAWE